MYYLLRRVLFFFDPEKVHYFTMDSLSFLLKLAPVRWFFKTSFLSSEADLETEVFGLKFKNPVGLAAGFDKNAEHTELMQSLGFGFIEIGSVTYQSWSGNPQPRLFRLPKDAGIINRMGLNNEGALSVAKRLDTLRV